MGRRWSSYTVLNARMYTHLNHPVTTTPMVHTLALVSHTCYSWYTQNTDQSAPQTTLFQDSSDSKFIRWPTNCNSKPHKSRRTLAKSDTNKRKRLADYSTQQVIDAHHYIQATYSLTPTTITRITCLTKAIAERNS